MLEVYCCPMCKRIAYVSKNIFICSKCNVKLEQLNVLYSYFVSLNEKERENLINDAFDRDEIC